MSYHNVKKALVIDDEASLRLLVRTVLCDEGWEVLEASCAEDGLDLLASLEPDKMPHVILLDMRMPGMDGLTALGILATRVPDIPVVLFTAYATVGQAVKAMKYGAFNYLTKPADNDELVAVLSKAYDFFRLRTENRELKSKAGPDKALESIIGQSLAMTRVKKFIEQAGPSEATVLVTGQSGTGKELVAEALHAVSLRASGPLVKINCAALPGHLLESELFGYMKGAFTGAVRDKPGRFQLASGGTLFLDEIGELPIELQAKLLRALQERMVEPLGGLKPVPVDVRIIAATNRDLAACVAEGTFREDLFFRLNVVEIHIPALKERMTDLPLLAAHLLERLCAKNNKTVRAVRPAFLEALSRYHWPGNVRELDNVLERALVLARSDALAVHDLPSYIRNPTTGDVPKKARQAVFSKEEGKASSPVQALDEAEKQVLVEALNTHKGHRQKTADALGISRRALQYKLKKYGLTNR